MSMVIVAMAVSMTVSMTVVAMTSAEGSAGNTFIVGSSCTSSNMLSDVVHFLLAVSITVVVGAVK